MRTVARSLVRYLSLAGALGLSACDGGSVPTLEVAVIGAPANPFESGVRLSYAGQLVRAATAQGLVALDEQGQVIPALADRWIVTDDGLSYIFRLRDGTWPDGSGITGESARGALRETLERLAGTPLSQEFAAIGEVRAMAGRVVEIRLERPVPDLLQLLAQPELALFHRGRGFGPMMLKRDGNLARLTKVPPGKTGWAEAVESDGPMRPVQLRALPAEAAIDAFADGKVDVVLGGRFDGYTSAESASGLSRRNLRIDPVDGLFGLVASAGNGPLSAPEVREALALAVDRDALAAELGIGGWTATTRLVASGIANDSGTIGERWGDLPMQRRRILAEGRIRRWEAGHQSFPRLTIALPQGVGAERLFARLAADFGAIGVPLARVRADAPANLQVLDIVARYNRPEWYLAQFTCAARRGQCSAKADARLAEALAEIQPEKRGPLLAEAEAEMTSANLFIPLGAPVRWSLVRGQLTGFSTNSTGFHPLPPLARLPR